MTLRYATHIQCCKPALKCGNHRLFFRRIQLQANATGDPASERQEREADAVANKVVQVSSAGVSSSFFKPLPPTSLQKKEAARHSLPAGVPVVQQVLDSPGKQIDQATKRFMEQRFGYDFSQVQIHDHFLAHQSAAAIHALAYTHGKQIVFAKGQYQPTTAAGRKLLAHELTHVLQQAGGRPAGIQKKDSEEKAPKQKDIIVVGEGWEGSEQLTGVLKRKETVVLKVNSVDQLVEELGKVDFRVGTIYVIAHSTAAGGLKFGKAEGFVKSSVLVTKLKGVMKGGNAPEKVEFRGCSVGKEPTAMNNLGSAIGANTVVAGNCYAVLAHSTPIRINGKPVTKAADVSPSSKTLFDELKRKTLDKFGNKKKCVLNRSDAAFFAAGGEFVLLWFNPAFSEEWKPGISVCYSDATTQEVDPAKALDAAGKCLLVKVAVKTPSL